MIAVTRRRRAALLLAGRRTPRPGDRVIVVRPAEELPWAPRPGGSADESRAEADSTGADADGWFSDDRGSRRKRRRTGERDDGSDRTGARPGLVGPLMRAVVVTAPGGPEVLAWSEVPRPRTGARRDRARRCGVGRQPCRPAAAAEPLPAATRRAATLGLECSGTVSAVGSGVTEWEIGQQVCALLSGGGYAEKVAVPEGHVLPVPHGVDLVTAAGLPRGHVHGVVQRVHDCRPASRRGALVHGGAGGVGTAAVPARPRGGRHGRRNSGNAASSTCAGRSVRRCW